MMEVGLLFCSCKWRNVNYSVGTGIVFSRFTSAVLNDHVWTRSPLEHKVQDYIFLSREITQSLMKVQQMACLSWCLTSPVYLLIKLENIHNFFWPCWEKHLAHTPAKISLADLLSNCSMASRRRRRRKLRQRLLWSRPPRAASPVPRRRCQLAAATRRKRRASWIRSWNSSRPRSWICLIKSNNVLGEASLSSYNTHQTKINAIPFFNPAPILPPWLLSVLDLSNMTWLYSWCEICGRCWRYMLFNLW